LVSRRTAVDSRCRPTLGIGELATSGLDDATINTASSALAVTTDYRYVGAEVVEKHLLDAASTSVLPGLTIDATRRLDLRRPAA